MRGCLLGRPELEFLCRGCKAEGTQLKAEENACKVELQVRTTMGGKGKGIQGLADRLSSHNCGD